MNWLFALAIDMGLCGLMTMGFRRDQIQTRLIKGLDSSRGNGRPRIPFIETWIEKKINIATKMEIRAAKLMVNAIRRTVSDEQIVPVVAYMIHQQRLSKPQKIKIFL